MFIVKEKTNDVTYNDMCKVLFLVPLFLLSFIFFNIFLSSLLFIFKISINSLTSVFSALLSVITNLLIYNKRSCNEVIENRTKIRKSIDILVITILPILIIGMSIFLNGKVLDYTFDGNSYQKGTTGLLAKGWNPLYQDLEDFEKDMTPRILIEDENPKYMNHYAKASNIFAANIYKLTGNIETGKCINTLSVIMIFLFTFSFLLYKKKGICFSVLFSLCVSTYPVVCSQFLTNYIDMLVYAYLYLIVFMFFLFEEESFIICKNDLLMMFLMILTVAINLKVSLFGYAGIFCLGYYIWYLIRVFKFKDKKISKDFLGRLTVVSILAVAIGIFVMGLSVYPKNIITAGHPFYPLFGEGKVDIMTSNQPDYFKEKSSLEKFIISTFSEVSNIIEITHEKAKYKVPFSIHEGEFHNLSSADTRISGNGIFFSGIFIISIFIIILSGKNLFIKEKNKFFLVYIPVYITIVMVPFWNEAWWARYYPQLYFLVLSAIIGLNNIDFENKVVKNICLYAFVGIILLNNVITFGSTLLTAYRNNVAYNIEFAMLDDEFANENLNERKLEVYASAFHGAKFNIIDKYSNNVKIVFKNEPINDEMKTLFGGRVRYKWTN